MNKNIEWLKEEVMNLCPSHNEMYEHPDYITVAKVDLINDFIELIDQLDEPEITEEQAWDLIYDKHGSKQHTALYKIYLEQNGYTVEKKEKLYTVCFKDKKNPHQIGIFLYKQDGKVNSGNAMDNYYPKDSESHLTEQEIKDYDERFWQFALPVEEEAE